MSHMRESYKVQGLVGTNVSCRKGAGSEKKLERKQKGGEFLVPKGAGEKAGLVRTVQEKKGAGKKRTGDWICGASLVGKREMMVIMRRRMRNVPQPFRGVPEDG